MSLPPLICAVTVLPHRLRRLNAASSKVIDLLRAETLSRLPISWPEINQATVVAIVQHVIAISALLVCVRTYRPYRAASGTCLVLWRVPIAENNGGNDVRQRATTFGCIHTAHRVRALEPWVTKAAQPPDGPTTSMRLKAKALSATRARHADFSSACPSHPETFDSLRDRSMAPTSAWCSGGSER